MINKHLLKAILVVLLFLSLKTAYAQISRGGEPTNWEVKDIHRFPVEFISMEELDMNLIQAQDEISDQFKDTPYRFGIEHEVSYDMNNSGVWEELEDGTKIWRIGFSSEVATSFSFLFEEFKLNKGAELTIWNAERTKFLGTFNYLNNKESGVLPTSLLNANSVVVEYVVPAGVPPGNLAISKVIEGYRAIINKFDMVDRGPYGNSGNCNIGINCPEAVDWQLEKTSVALIISGGFAECTGAMVNNTANDGTPYFLTANHCLGNPNNWVYVFNHESANCDGNTGPTTQTVSSGTLRASNGGSDFALVELSEAPPANYNVQFVGWDRSDDETVTSAVGIHHPSGDLKMICFENDNPYHDNQQGAAVWYIDQWEDGVTEGGSSGSPLFDQNHRVIGQLYGGLAACSGNNNNGGADWYGRFGVSWDGNNSSSRLRDWLDPIGSSPMVLDGWPEGAPVYAVDPGVSITNEFDGTLCEPTINPTAVLVNNGTSPLTAATITVTLNNQVVEETSWSGNLAQSEIATLELSTQYIAYGANTLEIQVVQNGDENNGNNTSIVEFNAITGDDLETHFLNLTLDNYPEETTWVVADETSVLASGGPYGGEEDGALVIEEFCLPVGCFEFIIYDEYGDGICCGFTGNGSYTITNENGTELVESNGQFDYVEEQELCTAPVSIQEFSSTEVKFYPNPVHTTLTIELAEKTSEIYVIDVSGRKVMELLNVEAGKTTVSIESLNTGTYMLMVNSNTQHRQAIFIKN